MIEKSNIIIVIFIILLIITSTTPINIPLDKQLIGPNWVYSLDSFYHACRKLYQCSSNIGKMGLNHNTSHVRPPQFLQAMILHYIFENVQPTSKYFIEFGFDANQYSAGGGANTGYLKYMRSWDGLLLDMRHKNHKINLHAHGIITPEVIVSLFHEHKVPQDVDYISIDVDSVDIFMLNSILKDGYYRPKVISIEYNCYFPIDSTIANIGYNVHGFHTLNQSKLFYNSNQYFGLGARFYGTSLKNVFILAEKYDYSIVAVDISVDAFLVRNDLLDSKMKLFDLEHYRSACTRHLFKHHSHNNKNNFDNDNNNNKKNNDDSTTSTTNNNIPVNSRHLQQESTKKKSQLHVNKHYNRHSAGKLNIPDLRHGESIADAPNNCWCMGPRQRTKNTTYFKDYMVDFEVYLNTDDVVLANGGNDSNSNKNYPGSYLDRMTHKYGLNFQQKCRNRDHDFDIHNMEIGYSYLNGSSQQSSTNHKSTLDGNGISIPLNKFDSAFARSQDFLNSREFDIKLNELKNWIKENQVIDMGR